jgi:tetratricopeptide (TPR) repeat protein
LFVMKISDIKLALIVLITLCLVMAIVVFGGSVVESTKIEFLTELIVGISTLIISAGVWLFKVHIKGYAKETESVILTRKMDIAYSSKNYQRTEQIASRLLEFNWPDIYACSLYVKSIPFNRSFLEKDRMYLKVLVDDFYSYGNDGRSERVLHIFLYGVFLKQMGNSDLAADYFEEALELAPDFYRFYSEYARFRD